MNYTNFIKEFYINKQRIVIYYSDYIDEPISCNDEYKFLSTSKRNYTLDEFVNIANRSGNIYSIRDFNDEKEVEDFLKENDYLYLKIGAYEHSAISVYPCKESPIGWDDYLFGFLYMPKKEIREIYHCKRVSKTIATDVLNCMENFVRITWNNYFLGTFYDVKVLDADGKIIEEEYQIQGEEDLRSYLLTNYNLNIESIYDLSA